MEHNPKQILSFSLQQQCHLHLDSSFLFMRQQGQNSQIRLFSENSASLQQVKSRRKRQLTHTSFWSKSDQIKAWMFFMTLIAEKGEDSVRWSKGHEDNTFVRMSKYIGKNRHQCKSFNQRMKTQHFKKRKLEIYEVAREELQRAKEECPHLKQQIDKIYHKKEEMDQQREIQAEFWKHNLKELNGVLCSLEGVSKCDSHLNTHQS